MKFKRQGQLWVPSRDIYRPDRYQRYRRRFQKPTLGFTFVNSSAGFDSSAPYTGSLTGVTAGNLLVILVQGDNNITYTAMSGNGNTYVQATSAYSSNGSTRNVDIWYVLSANSGNTTITITPSATPIAIDVHIYEFSYTGGTLAFDLAATASGSGVLSTTASITTATANELLVSLVVNNGNNSSTVTQPSTWAADIGSDGTLGANSSYLADAGVAGSKSANWSWPSFANYNQSIVAFKIVAGATTKPWYYYRNQKALVGNT